MNTVLLKSGKLIDIDSIQSLELDKEKKDALIVYSKHTKTITIDEYNELTKKYSWKFTKNVLMALHNIEDKLNKIETYLLKIKL